MSKALTYDELREKALGVLTEQLGPAETFRFLSGLRTRPRDYQAWRDARFKDVNLTDTVAQIRDHEQRNGR